MPWRLPGLRPLLNLNEWFVHHEDVRRANGAGAPHRPARPRRRPVGQRCGRMAPLMLRRVKGTGVALEAPGFGEVPARGDGPSVRIVGGPQELVLYLNGRRSGAEVDISRPRRGPRGPGGGAPRVS